MVLIGSANGPRTIKNPMTWEERQEAIAETVETNNLFHPIRFEPLEDHWYNYDRWIEEVRTKTAKHCEGQVALIGFHKDASSEYLNFFKPNFDLINVDPLLYEDSDTAVSATELRNAELVGRGVHRDMPHYLFDIQDFFPVNNAREVMNQLREEYAHIAEYKKSWAGAPFPPTFMCSDAFVMQSGHILMVRRGQCPGKGLFALPGGFIDPEETGLEAAIRELREETCLKVPEKVLRGSIFAERTFDAPGRSIRGRTFTMAYGFKLDDSADLPKVQGSDDADKAVWIPIETLRKMRPQVFEDHYDMIDWFLGQIK